MQTISVTLRPIGNAGLYVDVYAKTKVLRETLENAIEEALGCNTKEGPDFNGGYPYPLLIKIVEQLTLHRPQDNWYVTYWDTEGQPWEMRYNRPEKTPKKAG
jgi:hypothetical protein